MVSVNHNGREFSLQNAILLTDDVNMINILIRTFGFLNSFFDNNIVEPKTHHSVTVERTPFFEETPPVTNKDNVQDGIWHVKFYD